MTAPAGQTLLHYRLLEKIGEGGMGEVWSAEDTSLERRVAIKILPDSFAHDAERLVRFEREARLLASLNHPGIASVHGLHRAAGRHFLAMELVEGEDLARRLARGALPVGDALEVARQIAAAIEQAHDSGVLHRDLKPANVMVGPDDRVKVLDFGLAKALGPDAGSSDPSRSPTITPPTTLRGLILGTAAYMSPEQARGAAVDRRADVWAFGCLLYECLTGRRCFYGTTASDTLAEVLKSEPDWSALPAGTPPEIARLLRRCLAKPPRKRLHAIADARIELEEVLAAGPDTATAAGDAPPARARWSGVLPWGLAGLLAAALGLVWTGQLDGTRRFLEPSAMHVGVELPEDAAFEPMQDGFAWPSLALSPGGRRVAFVTGEGAGSRLYLRSLDETEARPLNDVTGVSCPFFSPDGRWVGFFAGGALMKTLIGGATTVTVAGRGGALSGGSWGSNDEIVFAPFIASGLWAVPAGGGEPVQLTAPDRGRGEVSHRYPHVLPGGEAVLFVVKTATMMEFDEARIAVLSRPSGEVRTVVEGGTSPRYLDSGHLLYVRGGTLLAAPFDRRRLEVTGPPVSLLDGVAVDQRSGAAHYDVSAAGWLLYHAARLEPRQVRAVWVDRQGRRLGDASAIPRDYRDGRLSPDGRTIAFSMPAANDKLWLLDTDRDLLGRLTFGPGNDYGAVWSPGGRWVAFASDRNGPLELFRVRTDGAGEEEPLPLDDGGGAAPAPGTRGDETPTSFHPGGRVLVFTRVIDGQGDVWTVPFPDGGTPESFLATRFDETQARFSPDGRWIAYGSTESGERQIYLRRWPGGGDKIQVTREGFAAGPHWRSDGRELFYMLGRTWMAVPVEPGPPLRVGQPVALFEIGSGAGAATAHDVAADGQRFLVGVDETPPRRVTRLSLVVGWSSEIERVMARGERDRRDGAR